jgi:6-carboxyhexanoate--CoA ligase
MSEEKFYNIRMRASTGANHISGAERITKAEYIDDMVLSLLTRAKSKGTLPKNITINIESLQNLPIRFLTALDVLTVIVPDVHSGRTAAARTLRNLEVSEEAVSQALTLLVKGASPSGKTMRGSIIMDALSSERLEPDQERGVRASRFDYSDQASIMVNEHLAAIGLTHYRTREALALATKVAHGPGVIAELCWSDDLDYTAGYVASMRHGYVRFPHLKKLGDQRGGRVIFVDPAKLVLNELIEYLQDEPVIISEVGMFNTSIGLEEYNKYLACYS